MKATDGNLVNLFLEWTLQCIDKWDNFSNSVLTNGTTSVKVSGFKSEVKSDL